MNQQLDEIVVTRWVKEYPETSGQFRAFCTATRCADPPLLRLPLPELIAQFAQETYSADLIFLLVQNIERFNFESSNGYRPDIQSSPASNRGPAANNGIYMCWG
ncbi:hypothetical protein DFH29DRAFT_966539 [Suillus ampliporus]|nr:hypothetical protein DFH29DRAFT_966539 [Suillus ampliporus]